LRHLIYMILCSALLTGCTAAKKVGETGGQVIGETANITGSVTEGGAGAVQGKTTKEENPFGR